MQPDSTGPVDLLDEIRAALDGVEPLLRDRVVDIEMARLRVLADPERFRRELRQLIESAVSSSDRSTGLTVRVARTGTTARIEVAHDDAERGGHRGDTVVGHLTLPLAPGTSGAADA